VLAVVTVDGELVDVVFEAHDEPSASARLVALRTLSK
jgi:hypothetical protein